MRLGKLQIEKLAYIPISAAQIVGCSVTRSLAKRGLMKALGKDGDSCFVVTPEGLEALAQALREGKCEMAFTIEKLRKSRSTSAPRRK